MPYLGSTIRTIVAKAATAAAPFGPGFPADLAERADHMEIWHSSVNDPGDDYNEFKLFAADGQLLASRRLNGY